jgi:hypothetical protein
VSDALRIQSTMRKKAFHTILCTCSQRPSSTVPHFWMSSPPCNFEEERKPTCIVDDFDAGSYIYDNNTHQLELEECIGLIDASSIDQMRSSKHGRTRTKTSSIAQCSSGMFQNDRVASFEQSNEIFKSMKALKVWNGIISSCTSSDNCRSTFNDFSRFMLKISNNNSKSIRLTEFQNRST